MYDINGQELEWIKKTLDTDFAGREILLNQIAQSQVSIRNERGLVSIDFTVDESVGRYPYNARVPVEMRAFQEETPPIVFLLHVVDGFVNELEVFVADLSDIPKNQIRFDTVEYVVSEEVSLNKG